MDEFVSSSVASRVSDLHAAFSDPHVKAVFSVVGGYNSNQLLRYLDYDLIRTNPKILCGFSDITAIANAITAKTGMITYSGTHFSTWAMQKEFDFNLRYFRDCLCSDSEYGVEHSSGWSDDPWFMDQENRTVVPDGDYWVINGGKAEGTVIGGHVRCLACLQ
ncbi:MAG: muramoyltetrapeptide carboxypeptidase [Patescibacteria group bacterium]|nr:muramoyltetrapeptide carboxypeptidase [Patescibacteria group bacterium]